MSNNKNIWYLVKIGSMDLLNSSKFRFDCLELINFESYRVFHVALTDFEGKFHNLWIIADSIANVF